MALAPSTPLSLRRVYVQLHEGADVAVFQAQTACVARLGRVHLSGTAPETDARGSWFELYLRSPVRDLVHLRQRLARVGVPAAVIHSVRPVTKAGEGRMFAKQLDLFGRLA